jgi:hypothetical protein
VHRKKIKKTTTNANLSLSSLDAHKENKKDDNEPTHHHLL